MRSAYHVTINCMHIIILRIIVIIQIILHVVGVSQTSSREIILYRGAKCEFLLWMTAFLCIVSAKERQRYLINKVAKPFTLTPFNCEIKISIIYIS